MALAFEVDRDSEIRVGRAVPSDAAWNARRAAVHADQIAAFGQWIARYREYLAAAVAGDVAECERLVARERAMRGGKR
jgi:hypothetical protein